MTGKKAGAVNPDGPAPPQQDLASDSPVPPVIANGRDSSSKRVLIVEDNETACKQIQVFLETDPGLSVDTAANGSDASSALAQRPVQRRRHRPQIAAGRRSAAA